MSSVLLEPHTHEIEDVKPYVPADPRPRPESYDSGEECSLAHLAHLYKLVELEASAEGPAIESRYFR